MTIFLPPPMFIYLCRYRMPEAYDDTVQGTRQDKRFEVAMQRYEESDAHDGNPSS